MDARERKEMFEGKERYAQRRNAENMKVETLTEEQHLMLDSLAALRHKFHCDYDALWNEEHPNNREMWDALSRDSEENISQRLENVGLPKLKLLFEPMVPTSEDWFYNLSDEEKEEWEEKAEAFNEKNPNASFMTAIRCGWKRAKNMRNFLKSAKSRTRKLKTIFTKSTKNTEHSMRRPAMQGLQIKKGSLSWRT